MAWLRWLSCDVIFGDAIGAVVFLKSIENFREKRLAADQKSRTIAYFCTVGLTALTYSMNNLSKSITIGKPKT